MFNLFQLRKRALLKKESEKVSKVKVPIEKKEPKTIKKSSTVKVLTPKKETVKKPVEVKTLDNPNSKKIFAYVGKKLVGEYDSITKCGIALGMSRPTVKKAIEFGETLDNGFKLKFK